MKPSVLATLFSVLLTLTAIGTPIVPAYQRLLTTTNLNPTEAGELLFSELSCAACHPSSIKTWKTGPDLTTVGDRLRAPYLQKFLADPAATKSGTTMPNLLATIDESQKSALIEDLTHHLMGQRSAKRSTTEPIVGNPKTGKTLFHQIGCIACHSDQPLQSLEEKYAPGALARFLLSPLTTRPSGRMPDQHLGKKDAAHLAAYLTPNPPATDQDFIIDPDRAQRGKKAFTTLGCVACHDKKPNTQLLPISDPQLGCLSPKPTPNLPHYPLSEDQRTALRTFITSPPKPASNPLLAIRQIMLQRNCFACHTRDHFGGLTPDIAAHFTSTKDDLGDLGRLPPPLDHVGQKFQRAALETVLKGRDPVRSYMRVKMPGFGDQLARDLSKLFAQADADAAPKIKPPDHLGTGDWGRELVGIKGYACIVCHDINGNKSPGIGAYDLAEMPKRLRPEWMRDFLLNPAAYPTGSRMPPFWPQGNPINPHIGGNTTERQIDSILRYLAEVDESLPPEGIANPAAIVLTPTDRPIIFRTFLKGTGTHAIAVGFPNSINLAFDALAVRWSLAWQGKFLDADNTWNQRYSKMEQPLGEPLIRLESIGTLTIIGQEDLNPQFRGYHITPEGLPIFDYDLGPLRIEDRLEPASKTSLKRTLRISGQTNQSVHLIATPQTNLKLHIPNHPSFPISLPFQNGTAELVEEISW